jgi:hypothetical protein
MGASIIENLKKGTEKIVKEQANKQGIWVHQMQVM